MNQRPIISNDPTLKRHRFPQPPNPKAVPQPVAKVLKELAELEERRDAVNKELYSLDKLVAAMEANNPELTPAKDHADSLRVEAADLRQEAKEATEAAVAMLAEQQDAILGKNNEGLATAITEAYIAAEVLAKRVAAVDEARFHSQWARGSVRGVVIAGKVPAVGTELIQRNGYPLPAVKAAEAVAEALRSLSA